MLMDWWGILLYFPPCPLEFTLAIALSLLLGVSIVHIAQQAKLQRLKSELLQWDALDSGVTK